MKGTSVEDLLEEEFNGPVGLSEEQMEQLFLPSNVPNYMLPTNMANLDPNRRKELIETYIRKPKYSVRRVHLLCEWINSLHIWPNKVTIMSLHAEMCNGVLLSRIVKHANPNVLFIHLNERPLTKRAAITNLEQSIGYIWRSKSLNNSRFR